jgi:SAM-dependent methyltransferase
VSVSMLRRGTARCPVVADALALPFRDGCFDLVLTAFCLNHLSRLDVGLAELRRVGAAVAASTAWRLGLAHYALSLRALDPPQRSEVCRAAAPSRQLRSA